MSNSDSFIDEVTEEVRRDRLYLYLRRYGWIAVAVVLILVGGAAWNEWRKARDAAAAQALGDAMLTALEADDAGDRVTALAAVDAGGPARAVAGMLTASEQERAGDRAAAVATLDALAVQPDVPAIYRDLAALKSLMLQEATMDPADRRTALLALAAPGAPLRMLALEQVALADLAAGDIDAALAGLGAIVEDAEVSQGLRDRAQALIVALGGTLDTAAAPQQ